MKLTIFNAIDCFRDTCKLRKKWGIYYSFRVNDYWVDITQAIPFLSDVEIVEQDHGMILFRTKKDMEHYYQQIVGDDGPTELNKYDGPAKVYAVTCDPKGNLLTENT
jgi:hypothetical protein